MSSNKKQKERQGQQSPLNNNVSKNQEEKISETLNVEEHRKKTIEQFIRIAFKHYRNQLKSRQDGEQS